MVKKIFLAICLVSFAAKISAADGDIRVGVTPEREWLLQSLAAEKLKIRELVQELAAAQLKIKTLTGILTKKSDEIDRKIGDLSQNLFLAATTIVANERAILRKKAKLAQARQDNEQLKLQRDSAFAQRDLAFAQRDSAFGELERLKLLHDTAPGLS